MGPVSAATGLAGQIAGLGLGIYGGLQSQHQQEWLNGAYLDQRDYARNALQQRTGMWNDIQGPLTQQGWAASNPALASYLQSNPQYMEYLSQMPGFAEQAVQAGQNWMQPQQVAPLDGMREGTDQFGQMGRDAWAGYQGGGWSEAGQNGLNWGSDFANLNTPDGQTLSDAGRGILGTGGATAFNMGVTDRAGDALNRGGMTNTLDGALQWAGNTLNGGGSTANTYGLGQGGAGLMFDGGQTGNTGNLSQFGNRELQGNLGTGGLTGTGAAGMQVALRGLGEGGQSEFGNAIQSYATGLMKQNPLMTMEQAMSMAQDAAGTQYANAAEAVSARAIARGGGAGATVANGAQNRALSEFAEQGAEGVAKAGRDAAMTQQQLELQRLNSGLGFGLNALGDQNNRLGTFGGILGGLENTAANRFNTGGSFLSQADNNATSRFNAGVGATQAAGSLENQRFIDAMGQMVGVQNSANNNMNVLGGLGINAEGSQNNFLGTGTSMLNSNQNFRLGGLGAYNNGLGQMNNYALGQGRLGMEGIQNQMTGNQNQFNSYLAGQNAGVNNAATNFGIRNQAGTALGSGQASQLPWYNAGNQILGNYANQLVQQQGMYGNMMPNVAPAGPQNNFLGITGGRVNN